MSPAASAGYLLSPAHYTRSSRGQIPDAATQQRLLMRAGELARNWSTLSPLRARAILLGFIQRIDVRAEGLEIHSFPSQVAALLGRRPAGPTALASEATGETSVITISVAAELSRVGQGVRMIFDPSDPGAPPSKPDPSLVKTIIKAHRFNDRLLSGDVEKFADLARTEKLHGSYYSQILRLPYLAPDITAAILDGRQPPILTATMLIEHPSLPLSWREQRIALGFA